MLRFLQWVNQPFWGQFFCNLLQNQNPGAMILVILQVTFMLESHQVLLILAVRSLDNFAVIKTHIIVPHKLGIFDFRGLSILKVLPQRQVVSTTHALFYSSTSCLESENEMLQDYLLRLSFQRQVQDIILWYSETTSTFISSKSSVESLMMKLLMERSFSNINCLPTQWYLHWEKNAAAKKLR